MSYNNTNLRIIEAESFDERFERLCSFADKNHTPANVEAVKTSPEGSYLLKTWTFGTNLVTDTGDVYYAERGAGGSVTNDFAGSNGRIELRTSADTPAKGDTTRNSVAGLQSATRKGHTSTYPKANDGDTDNTGKGTKVTTYKFGWLTTDFNLTGLVGGCIDAAGASPQTTSPILNHFSIASFDKTSSDTLTMYINHAFAGS